MNLSNSLLEVSTVHIFRIILLKNALFAFLPMTERRVKSEKVASISGKCSKVNFTWLTFCLGSVFYSFTSFT